jgi:hypothetical protein
MGRTAQFAICADPNTPNRTGGATTTNASLSCPSGTPQYIIGSGGPSQSNVLQVRTWGGSISAKLRAGDHNFRLLGEWNHTKTFNLFVNPSAGSYYFDSIADFRNGNAQSFSYNNAGTLNPNDAAANFSYDTYTFGLQDDWRVNKMLSVTAGLRYDVYGTSSHPQLNPNFLTRYGFPNTYSIEGMGLLQPRVGFTFTHAAPDRSRRRRYLRWRIAGRLYRQLVLEHWRYQYLDHGARYRRRRVSA